MSARRRTPRGLHHGRECPDSTAPATSAKRLPWVPRPTQGEIDALFVYGSLNDDHNFRLFNRNEPGGDPARLANFRRIHPKNASLCCPLERRPHRGTAPLRGHPRLLAKLVNVTISRLTLRAPSSSRSRLAAASSKPGSTLPIQRRSAPGWNAASPSATHRGLCRAERTPLSRDQKRTLPPRRPQGPRPGRHR